MKATQRLCYVAILVLVSISVGPRICAQGLGPYVAGVNFPAGPPSAPTNTGFWIGGISPVEIHYGDFNGDGKLDVVAASNCGYNPWFLACPLSGSVIAVYLSNGDGTFQAPVVSGLTLPNSIRSMIVGDFNGDGKLDVAVGADAGGGTNGSDGTITVLLGNGDGTFTQSSQYAVNGIFSQASTLAVGDFNNDGKLDLAVGLACYNIPVTDCSFGAVRVYLGVGDGTLSAPTTYTTVGNGAILPVVSDFNGDGKLDVIAVVNGSASLAVLIGNGDGTFNQPSNDQVPLAPSLSNVEAVSAGDLNSDGRQDLVLTPYQGNVNVALGNGDGTFQSPTVITTGISYLFAGQVIDLNHDGHPDIIVSGSQNYTVPNGVQVFLNDGNGNFMPGTVYGLTGSGAPGLLATVDFNGDGNPDILVGTPSGGYAEGILSILLGNSDGTMQGARYLNQASLGGSSAIAVDINGDGIPDIIEAGNIVTGGDQGGILVFLGTGNGQYAPPVPYDTGVSPGRALVAGDFNGDGKIDIVVASLCFDSSCAQGGVSILLGNGDGTFQPSVIYATGAQYAYSVAVGDFNGDGKLDVAVANQFSSVGILLGNGDGTLQPVVVTAAGSQNLSIAAADFNGDGKTDIALDSYDPGAGAGSVQILLSGDNGALTLQASYPSGGSGNVEGSVAVADVNGDGKFDIVAANQCQLNDSGCAFGSLATLIGNGDGTFVSGPIQTIPDGNLYSLLIADVNGDGVLDAVAADPTGVEVFLGKGDGSFVTPIVYAGVQSPGQNTSVALADLNLIQPGGGIDQSAIFVNRAGTYLVSQSSANPSTGSQTIQLTTAVSASYLTGITPTGSISYYDGTTFLGSAVLTGGTASLNVSSLSQGVHTITYHYSGDPNFYAHYGTPILQVVTGGAPVASFSTLNLAFGNQDVGSSSMAQVVTLTNTGSSMTLSGVVIGGTNATDFTQINTCVSTLASEASCTISVTFAPTATGSRTAYVSISDNAAGSPQMVSLSGTGTLPGLTLNPTTIAFGNEVTGTTSSATNITLSNPGSGILNITSIAVTGTNSGDFAQTNNCGTSVPASGNCTIFVMFAPTASGARSASVTVTDNSTGSPQTVTLTGAGLLPLAMTPATLSFGNQGVASTSAAKVVTLKNNSALPVTFSSITITGTNAVDFAQSATTCGYSLAPAKSCTFSITFTPTVTAAETASFTVADTATNSPQTVALTGTGVQPASLSANALSFGNQGLNNSSAAKTVTLANNDSAAITISGIAISGVNQTEFAQSATTCGASLNGHTSCTISVTFTPVTTGAMSATLTIIDSASDSPQTVSLKGTGVQPVTLSVTTLAFGNQAVFTTSAAKTVTVKNNNSVALTLSSIAIAAAPADFAQSGTTCSASIAADSSCTVSATYSPSILGAETGTLTLIDTAGNSPQILNLTGTGVVQVSVTPTSLTFASLKVGTLSSAKTLTIKNNLPTTLTISGITIGGTNQSDFAQSATTCGASLAPSASCTVNVIFEPQAIGSRSASLTVSDSAVTSPQTVALSGTGK